MRLEDRVARIEAELGFDVPRAAFVPWWAEAAPALHERQPSFLEVFGVRTIGRHVCREMNLDFETLLTSFRATPLFHARCATAFLARTHLHRTYPQIGRALRVDHSSVIHQCRRAEALIASDDAFHQLVDIVSRRLFRKAVVRSAVA